MSEALDRLLGELLADHRCHRSLGREWWWMRAGLLGTRW